MLRTKGLASPSVLIASVASRLRMRLQQEAGSVPVENTPIGPHISFESGP
jgi:hypothetical protein